MQRNKGKNYRDFLSETMQAKWRYIFKVLGGKPLNPEFYSQQNILQK